MLNTQEEKGRAGALTGTTQKNRKERHNNRKYDDRVNLESSPSLAKSCSGSSRAEIPPGLLPPEQGTAEVEEATHVCGCQWKFPVAVRFVRMINLSCQCAVWGCPHEGAACCLAASLAGFFLLSSTFRLSCFTESTSCFVAMFFFSLGGVELQVVHVLKTAHEETKRCTNLVAMSLNERNRLNHDEEQKVGIKAHRKT